jgi:hypothetical protein
MIVLQPKLKFNFIEPAQLAASLNLAALSAVHGAQSSTFHALKHLSGENDGIQS